jgi:methionine biosynthesis protein MetW
MSNKSPTAEYYDENWKTKHSRSAYDSLENRWRTRWQFVLERIEDGSRVLDMGCGDGVIGGLLVDEHDCEVHGVDVSEYALENAREKGVETDTCNISREPLPYDDDEFDAVLLLCVLEHIPRPEFALEEASRVVRPGGDVYVSLPNPLRWNLRLAFLKGELHPDLLHQRPGEGTHYRFFNYEDGLETIVDRLELPITLAEKEADVKNPNKYSTVGLWARRRLISRFPSLFCEYMNYRYTHPA